MVSKKFILSILPLFLLSACNNQSTPSQEEEKRVMHNESVYKDGVDFDSSLWSSPEFFYEPTKDKGDIKALYIRSDYKDEESYAFAYLGYPSIKKEKMPAVLLLHGGAGTAYYEWVEEYTKLGFVALAIDLEGHVPLDTGNVSSMPQELYEKSKYNAPHNVNLTDGNLPIKETWLYYACKTAIIGNSFLHNLENVDIYNIGVSGVSWGGFITSIIGGYDDRFSYLNPIYCTLSMEGSGSPIGDYITSNPTFRVFDSVIPLSLVKTPFHLVMSNSDKFQNLVRASEVVETVQNGTLSILDRWNHSQADANSVLEPYQIALSHANNEEIPSISLTGNTLKVGNLGQIKEAYLYESFDETLNQNTRFLDSQLTITTQESSLNLDQETTYYYVSILTEKNYILSTSVLKQ